MLNMLGYMMGGLGPDKDGVSAIARFGELAVRIYQDGGTVAEFLDSLYKK